MQTLLIISMAVFCGLGGYIIGIRRGWKTYERPCPQEDLDTYYDAGYDAGRRSIIRELNLQRFMEELDDLMGPEENDGNSFVTLDGGDY